MNDDNVKIGRARAVLPPCPFPVFPVAINRMDDGDINSTV